jgi:ABC-type transport system involved in multi-copper enzyme maturation permease subunit
MPKFTGTYRAALSLGRRRGVLLLLVIGVALFGALAWGSYRDLSAQRNFLHALRTSDNLRDAFRHFGIACSGGDFGPPPPEQSSSTEPTPGTINPEPGNPEPGSPEKPGVALGPGGTGNLECQFVGPDGTPIGPTFTQDPFNLGGPDDKNVLTPEQMDQIRPELIKGQEGVVALVERQYSPRYLFETRVRALGTFVGTVFVVLLGATFIGAEYRWGVVRTLLTHEPRRGRVMAGKLLALWTLVIVAYLLILAVVSGVDVVMRQVTHVHASGGPSAVRIGKQVGWAILSLELWTTMAASLATLARVSIGGIATLLATVGDHLLVQKYHWLRAYLPTQQVGSLLPTPTRITTAYLWYSPVTGGFVCERAGDGFFSNCREIMLKPIPHWRASLVLGAWIIGFALLAWAVLRARDVPQ